MERTVYERMNELEARHWWFVGRRSIIATLIERHLNPKPDALILEAGCGSGGNLAMLGQYGHVDAFEFDGVARDKAKEKSGLDIRFGELPETLPFDERRYDLIGLFDVLEHVEADSASLSALAGRLNDSGKILVTVPAFRFLWSRHDERHHHFRRYTRASLEAAANKAGLKVSYSGYFNALLFPLAITARWTKRILGSDTPDDRLPPAWLNVVLTRIFRFERRLIARVRLPVGLSLAAVLEKA